MPTGPGLWGAGCEGFSAVGWGTPLLTPHEWETILMPFIFFSSGTCVPKNPRCKILLGSSLDPLWLVRNNEVITGGLMSCASAVL